MNEKKKPLTEKQIRYFVVAFIILNIVLATITVCILSQRFQTTTLERNPKFVLASWDYPDEHGQGIDVIEVFENSTGSWVKVGGNIDYTDDTLFEWNSSVGIKLKVWTWQNFTLTGAVSGNDGKNYHRHNVNVASGSNSSIFSQQNFTYSNYYDDADPMYYYVYEVVLDFLPAEFTTYVVTVNYEIYQEFSEEEYQHECSDTSGIEYQGNYYLGANDYGIDSNGSVVESWIVPDDSNSEGVLYKLNFTNIDNSIGTLNIAARYRVEGATNFFRYRIVYDDASYNDSALGTSTDWATLNIVPETGKVLDYFILYNVDTPPNTNSGNLSVWIDYIVITNDFAEWIENTEVQFSFITLMGEATIWTFNMIFIFGGIILRIGSACIVAKKVRDRTITNDNVFLFILLFFVGWCFFASGGVLG